MKQLFSLLVISLISSVGFGQSMPNTTFSFAYTCDRTIVTRNSEPPATDDWYWQTSASATSTSHGNNATLYKTITGPLFLRARKKAFPNTWSTAQPVGTVTVYTTAPNTPATSTNATRIGPGPITVSVGAVSGATNYGWYTQPSGAPPIPGVTTNTYVIPSLSATQTYYVAAFAGDFITGCVSGRRPVTAKIEPLPQVSISGSQCVDLANSVTLSATPGFDSYTWKNGNQVVGTGNTLTTSTDGYYTVTVTKAGISGDGTTAPFRVKSCLAQQNLNFIISSKLLTEIANESSINNQLPVEAISRTIDYFDGLGRPMQSVAMKASPGEKDIVQPSVYDLLGREYRKYLPVGTGGSDGFFKGITFDASGNYSGTAANFYSNNPNGKIAQDSRPFSEVIFETSPVNRPLKNYGPGVAWSQQGSNKFIEYQYSSNEHGIGASDHQEKIIAWNIDLSGMPIRNSPLTGYVETGGYFSSGQLLVKKTIDEHQNVTREYINKQGQIVLKKVQVVANSNDLNNTAHWALTYNIYDDFGNLRYVFPPELSKLIHESPDTYIVTPTNLNSWAFQYKYDKRARMTHKQVPGASIVYMVYDNRDRLVMTQDGNLRVSNQWTYTKYDVLNRPIITGIYTHGSLVDQSVMSGLISTSNFYETYNGVSSTHGYTNTVFPATGTNALTITYYDNYSFKSMVSGLNYVNELAGQPGTEMLTVRGQVTGTKINILGTPNYLYSINYFDHKYRVIQTTFQNHKSGFNRITNTYDFPGRVTKSRRTYIVSGVTKTIDETFTYDHAGRLEEAFHSVNGSTPVLLFRNNYNELGQLVDKKLHSADNGTTFKQSVDYRYNVRGWLTSINNSKLNDVLNNDELNDIFGMELGYETDLGLGAPPQYNGNISAVKWSNNSIESNVLQRGYAFSYDGMNRISTASQKEAIVFDAWTGGNYNENITAYDLNGNILGLQRMDGNGALIDNLTYNYGSGVTASNKLMFVNDAADAVKGFVNGNTGNDDYDYDANGNLKFDKNKGITAITYNYLNLPQQVNKGATDYIMYTYDATGKKLSQQVFGSTAKTTDYVDELIFENNNLQFINHGEGRVLPDGANWEYQYHLKDHLGNIRATFTAKETTDAETATLETANAPAEQSQFLRFAEARKIQSYLFDRSNGASPTTTIGYAQRLSGAVNEKFGLAKSISVMPGDIINAEVYAKYIDPITNNWTGALATLMGYVLAPGSAPAGTVVDGASYTGSTASFPFPVAAAQNTAGSSEAGPKAYLNWLVFKRDGTFVLSQSGYDRISTAPKESGQDVAHERLFSPNITVTEPGFVYVYLSNEEGTPLEVYFDDFKVTHIVNTPVIQSDDYYPFGLTFNSYQRENNKVNYHLYNGKEKQDELDLGWLDYGARMYQSELGRFVIQDRFSDEYLNFTPYQYAANNPLLFIDVNGDSIKTYFYDKNGKRMTSVPGEVQNMFNSEYGISVGYNSKTGMLYYSGEVETENAVSESAKESIVSALSDDVGGKKAQKKYGTLVFGFGNWGDHPPPLGVDGGGAIRSIAWIDMSDFNKDGSEKRVNYSHLDATGVSRRVWNLGRTFEHEWIGHVLNRRGDGFGGRQGPTVKIVNKFQVEMGLPQRLNYAGYLGIFFSHDNSRSSYRRLINEVRKGKTVPRVLLNKK